MLKFGQWPKPRKEPPRFPPLPRSRDFPSFAALAFWLEKLRLTINLLVQHSIEKEGFFCERPINRRSNLISDELSLFAIFQILLEVTAPFELCVVALDKIIDRYCEADQTRDYRQFENPKADCVFTAVGNQTLTQL